MKLGTKTLGRGAVGGKKRQGTEGERDTRMRKALGRKGQGGVRDTGEQKAFLVPPLCLGERELGVTPTLGTLGGPAVQAGHRESRTRQVG